MYNRNYFFLGFAGFFLSGAWVKADPATLLTFLGVFGLRRSFEAFDATCLDVFSFFAMILNFLDESTKIVKFLQI